jgi:manganese/zinc/iron transport system permease protein
VTAADFLTIDLPAMLVAVFAATSCGLLGNFLVLRRQALIGDAISHVVLPGIVAGFLVAGAISTLPLMLGAMAAAILAAGLIELIQRAGRLESGAAMGVVFTTMFAGGIVLLEQSGAANVHLDAEHALYGNLESTLWLGVTGWSDLTSAAALAELPRTLVTLAAVTAFVAVLVVLFFKELQVTTFDAGLAASLGLPVRAISVSLIVVVAVAAVAAFETVGSILVIAMFICPAATARLLTDNLARQLWISAAVAAVAGIGGYVAAAFGPGLWGGTDSLSAAGMIAVAAGALQTLAILFAPRYGVVSQARQRAARRLDLAGGNPV